MLVQTIWRASCKTRTEQYRATLAIVLVPKHHSKEVSRGSDVYAAFWNLGVDRRLILKWILHIYGVRYWAEVISCWVEIAGEFFLWNLMTSWTTISFSRKTLFLGFRSIILVRNHSLVMRVEINKLKSEIVFKWTGVYNLPLIMVTKFLTAPKLSNSKSQDVSLTSYLYIQYVTVFLLRAKTIDIRKGHISSLRFICILNIESLLVSMETDAAQWGKLYLHNSRDFTEKVKLIKVCFSLKFYFPW
jgi:hypothetical protein